MTELYIDGNIIEYEDTGKNSTIGDFVKEVENQLSEVKQLIVGIEVDGNAAEDMHSHELLSAHVAEHKEIRLSTAPLKAVLEVGLSTCNEYIPHINGTIGAILDALREGNNNKAFNLLPGLFDALNELVRTLAVINTSVTRYNLEIFKESPVTCYESLVTHLSQILSARDAGDLILIGDLLDYEIIPIIETLEKLLAEADIDF